MLWDYLSSLILFNKFIINKIIFIHNLTLMNKDMKNNISILTNLYITYNQIKLFIVGDTKKFISIISAFLLVFLIRSSLAIIDTLFIANEFPIQRIIFILSTFARLVWGLHQPSPKKYEERFMALFPIH